MKIERRIHPGFKESILSRAYFGKYQYICSSKKGSISLARIVGIDGLRWEIYCLKGKLFEDIESFDDDFKGAINRVIDLLESSDKEEK